MSRKLCRLFVGATLSAAPPSWTTYLMREPRYKSSSAHPKNLRKINRINSTVIGRRVRLLLPPPEPLRLPHGRLRLSPDEDERGAPGGGVFHRRREGGVRGGVVGGGGRGGDGVGPGGIAGNKVVLKSSRSRSNNTKALEVAIAVIAAAAAIVAAATSAAAASSTSTACISQTNKNNLQATMSSISVQTRRHHALLLRLHRS